MKSLTLVRNLLLCLITFLFIPVFRVHATGEFQADYDVQYAVAPSGVTIVTQNVTLTNKQTNLYPQKYSIIIDSEKIRNVIAFDTNGIVTPEIKQQDGKTDIILPFNDKVIGLGKQLHFSLRYEDGDIAHNNGKIWEINVPGVANDPDLETYTVSLRVPPAFGTNAYMTPPPAHGDTWTKDQMVTGGISAAFGTEQYFTLDLSYYVENNSVTPRSAEIALPPATAYQQVKIQSLDPKPKNVLSDADGNWLAQYDLLPMQKLTVHAKIFALLTLHARPGVTDDLADRDLYTKPLKYWESQNSTIMNLAHTYKTPREIYGYVTHALAYDYSRVRSSPVRKGAVEALTSPKNSICMEFTDLFIAIARAAGIPAREAVGFAYTTNAKLRPLSLVSDVLHSWPEYYDDQRNIWVPVDPTWANTTGGVNYFDKLDFNHIIFAIHGQSSDYPYPAGFYKKNGSNTKDVLVQFADMKPDFHPSDLVVRYQFPQTVTSGIEASGNILIQNTSGVATSGTTVAVQSTPFNVNISKSTPQIPPFGTYIVPVTIPLPGYFLHTQGQITTSVNGQTSQFAFQIVPLVYKFLVPLVCLVIIFLLVLFVLIRRKFKHGYT